VSALKYKDAQPSIGVRSIVFPSSPDHNPYKRAHHRLASAMSKRKHNLNLLLNSINIHPLAKRRKYPAPPPVVASNPASGLSTSTSSQQPAQTPSQAAYQRIEPPPAHSSFQTGKSVVNEVLAVIRDGSDLFLPLKAALVGIVKIMDVMEVRRYNIYPALSLT
jgi:hypothetical protein